MTAASPYTIRLAIPAIATYQLLRVAAGLSAKSTEAAAKGLPISLFVVQVLLGDEVVGMGYDGDYVVKTKEEEYRAGVVILATGSPRRKPAIARLEEFEGKGVAYCAEILR